MEAFFKYLALPFHFSQSENTSTCITRIFIQKNIMKILRDKKWMKLTKYQSVIFELLNHNSNFSANESKQNYFFVFLY